MSGKFINSISQFFALLGVSVFILISCQGTQKDARDVKRPAAVDHSTTKYFPPIGDQKLGDCTCWSSCYYYNTYTQARDHDLDASTSDPEVLCSPRFLFSQISQGTGGAECTEHAMERLSELGCANVSDYPMDTHYAEWAGEEARIAALRNRTGKLYKIRVDNPEGLETVKQHISNGGCATTRGLFRANYPTYGESATGPGIDKAVMYAKVGENYLRHSLCICGYDDEKSYVDNRDGKTYSGAFLIANSEGQQWGSYNSTGKGSRGFIWVAYNMFLEGTFGLYDQDDNPYKDHCFDNPPYPTIYFHDDLPDYKPSLYAVVGINHDKRNMLRLRGGIGPSDSPEYIGYEAIEPTKYGLIAIDDTKRIVIDLTDGATMLESQNLKQVFVELFINSSGGSNATITSADFYYSPKADGNYITYSYKDKIVTVEPGNTGYAVVEIKK
ncbi:hypothetical protein ACFLSY_00760 [Bacteroidota bacterium]